jgi:hypothetical protein
MLLRYNRKRYCFPEPTFAHPRYSLGGHRPSQTAHHSLFLAQSKISSTKPDERYFTRTSILAKAKSHKLPPMLRISSVVAMNNYSKGV